MNDIPSPPGRWLVLLAAVGTLILVAAGSLGKAGIYDDGYIFLRYAENIAGGLGPVFNEGERVEGFSSPLWTFLLALLALTPANMELAATVLGVLMGTGMLAALGLLLLDVDAGIRWEWGALILYLALFPPLAYHSFSGMDHPIFTMLVALVLWSGGRDLKTGRVSWLTSALLFLAFAARSEGCLLATWIGGLFIVRSLRGTGARMKEVLLPLACSAAAMAGLVGLRFLYYGSIVPNTFHAKVTPDGSARLAGGISYLVKALPAHAPLLLITVAMTILTARQGTLPWRKMVLPGGWLAIWAGFIIYAGGDHFPMYRAALPALPALLALAGCAVAPAARHLQGFGRTGLRAALAACLVATPLICHLDQGKRGWWERHVAEEWAKYGRWIHDNTPADTVVATNVIGAIGYFGKRPMVDLLGLIDPVVAREGRVYSGAAHGHSRYHTEYILRRAPDLIVFYTRADTREDGMSFVPPAKIRKRYAYALFDLANNPETYQGYEQIMVPTEDGVAIEMLKRRGFPLDALYLTAPDWNRTEAPEPVRDPPAPGDGQRTR